MFFICLVKLQAFIQVSVSTLDFEQVEFNWVIGKQQNNRISEMKICKVTEYYRNANVAVNLVGCISNHMKLDVNLK